MEDRLTCLEKEVKLIKTKIYTLVNLLHNKLDTINKDPTHLEYICKYNEGDIDEKGSIFITDEMLTKTTDEVKAGLSEKAYYWISVFESLDKFLECMVTMTAMKDYLVLNDEPILEKIFNTWSRYHTLEPLIEEVDRVGKTISNNFGFKNPT